MVNIKPVRGLPRSSFFWSMAAILGDFVRTYVCRAHAPASHTACHDDHENSNAWFSQFLSSHGSYGTPLCGPSGRCVACSRLSVAGGERKKPARSFFRSPPTTESLEQASRCGAPLLNISTSRASLLQGQYNNIKYNNVFRASTI